MVAAPLRRYRCREAGVHDDLAPGAANQPDEVVEGHGAVVRVAADEVLQRAARVVRVLDRVELVQSIHLMVTRATFLFPTWMTGASPRLNCRFRSLTFSPFT